MQENVSETVAQLPRLPTSFDAAAAAAPTVLTAGAQEVGLKFEALTRASNFLRLYTHET